MKRNNTLYENAIGSISLTGPLPGFTGTIPVRPDRFAIRVRGASEHIRQGQTISSYLLGPKAVDESEHQTDMIGFMVTMTTVPSSGKRLVDWPMSHQAHDIDPELLHHDALAGNSFAKTIRQTIEMGAEVKLFKLIYLDDDFGTYDILCVDLLFKTVKMQEASIWPEITPHNVTTWSPLTIIEQSPRQAFRQQYQGIYIDDRLQLAPSAMVRAVMPRVKSGRKTRRQNRAETDAAKVSKSARRRQRKRLAHEERLHRGRTNEDDEHDRRQDNVFQNFQTMVVSEPE